MMDRRIFVLGKMRIRTPPSHLSTYVLFKALLRTFLSPECRVRIATQALEGSAVAPFIGHGYYGDDGNWSKII